ncbi:MAG: hypothetical protein HY046_14040 [Acidobacteria bacterium]|nr:hypothetical protein [Acidobacteriota bacterium]
MSEPNAERQATVESIYWRIGQRKSVRLERNPVVPPVAKIEYQFKNSSSAFALQIEVANYFRVGGASSSSPASGELRRL